MDFHELKRRHLQVVAHIGKKQIKDALNGLDILCNHCQNKDLRSQLENHTETYANILKYSFETGDDPERERVYLRLVRSVLGLADDVKEDIIRSNKLLRYYTGEETEKTAADQLFAELLKGVDDLGLEEEAGITDGQGTESAARADRGSYRNQVSAIFRILLLSD